MVHRVGGSLDKILGHPLSPESPFARWGVRHSVALDVARGLKYLHHDCSPGIIHRDMKPANILLDEKTLMAHVADFGLAQEADALRSHLTAGGVFGTPGFIAPEYGTKRRMSFKSDVYAYGVTLIQLVTGRDTTEEDIAEKGLRRWASEGREVLDPAMKLEGEHEVRQALSTLDLALLCTARVPVDRPSMEEVVHILTHLTSSPIDLPFDTSGALGDDARASSRHLPGRIH